MVVESLDKLEALLEQQVQALKAADIEKLTALEAEKVELLQRLDWSSLARQSDTQSRLQLLIKKNKSIADQCVNIQLELANKISEFQQHNKAAQKYEDFSGS
ncbi:hypothetical protein [Nitrincola sp. MINF-07-Sa-05]|uniref:hypothetical protein n=1 Tax=Nitrincola salilacus TaxID=3400273 RepID=UPI0039180AD4